jgi:hypothetical protein
MNKPKAILTITISALLFMQSCQTTVYELETETVCLIDGTESTVQYPKYSELKPFLTQRNVNNGVCFKASIISDIDFDLSLNKCLDFKNTGSDITEEERYLQNKKYLREVEKSYNDLVSNIQHAEGKSHSVIYRVVTTELIKLSKSPAKNKVLLVYSDLFENSDLLNVYSPKGKQLLANPEKIEQLFTEYLSLPDLSGIKVYLIYKPKDFQENQKYRTMATVYTNILTSAGCEVIVSGHLTQTSKGI